LKIRNFYEKRINFASKAAKLFHVFAALLTGSDRFLPPLAVQIMSRDSMTDAYLAL